MVEGLSDGAGEKEGGHIAIDIRGLPCGFTELDKSAVMAEKKAGKGSKRG
jgi:hypothetical protein